MNGLARRQPQMAAGTTVLLSLTEGQSREWAESGVGSRERAKSGVRGVETGGSQALTVGPVTGQSHAVTREGNTVPSSQHLAPLPPGLRRSREWGPRPPSLFVDVAMEHWPSGISSWELLFNFSLL